MNPDKNHRPFLAIAWSPSLLAIFGATVIWGLFPLFFHFIGDFEEYPSVYLLSRYSVAGIFFILLSGFFSFQYKKTGAIISFISRYKRALLYGGCILFLARYFEAKAFEGKITNFATIFSVALVPIMEPVLVFLLYRPKCTKWIFSSVFGREKADEMTAIISKNENYWFEYFLNAILIFISALFFIYGMQGDFNIFASDAPWHAYLWVLPSAMALQLYFHSLDYGFPDSNEKNELTRGEKNPAEKKKFDEIFLNFSPTLVKQTFFAIVITCSCLIWHPFSDSTFSAAFKTIGNPVVFGMAFIGGIVILGSIVAYALDNAGFDEYEEEKKTLPFKIRGVEWLGVSTLMDPLIANFLIVGCASFGLYLGKEGEILSMKPAYFFICIALIIFLAILKVLMLHHNKMQEFKVFCFSLFRSRRTAGETVDPDHFSAVAMLRQLEEIQGGNVLPEIKEVCRFRSKDVPAHALDRHLQYQLWRFNCNHMELREEIAIWVMKEGKHLYDAKQLFERLLFHEHMRYFCTENSIQDGRIFLFFPDKLRFDENKLRQMIKEDCREETADGDQLFYFIHIPDENALPSLLQDYLQKRWQKAADRKPFSRLRDAVMMDVLQNNEGTQKEDV